MLGVALRNILTGAIGLILIYLNLLIFLIVMKIMISTANNLAILSKSWQLLGSLLGLYCCQRICSKMDDTGWAFGLAGLHHCPS